MVRVRKRSQGLQETLLLQSERARFRAEEEKLTAANKQQCIMRRWGGMKHADDCSGHLGGETNGIAAFGPCVVGMPTCRVVDAFAALPDFCNPNKSLHPHA